MPGRHNKAGMTLVEVLIAVVLVSVAATLVYNGGFYSYKMLMRSRLKLEAQGVAFDKLWQVFNMSYDNLPSVADIRTEPTPEGGALSTNGLVRYSIIPQTGYWEMTVQVWAPSNSMLFSVMDDDGTVLATSPNPLAEYTVLRYGGDR